jgi:predicted dehydrogenase
MDVLKVALFGLGGVAERIHVPACRELAELRLVGACDPDSHRREQMARRLGGAPVCPDARGLLAGETPDLVIIGTPPDSHRELALLALAAGAHVLCEKPFMRTVAEADEVIAVARSVRRTVWVNNQYRYMPIYAEAQRRARAGEFGEPYFLQCWQQMFHPPDRESNWRASLRQSTLYEFGTHALDLACFFFDALPEAVSAVIPRVPHGVDADVLVQATLRFPGERLATFAFNRVSHAPMRYLEMRLDCREASLRLSLGGVARLSLEWSAERRRPTLRASLARGGEARVERGGESRTIWREARPGFAAATAGQLREMIAAIRDGHVGLERAEHARELLRVVFAGYESARAGETVWLTARGR